MKKSVVSEPSFKQLKAKTETFISKIEEITKDPQLQEKELLESALQSVQRLIAKCEAKLAE